MEQGFAIKVCLQHRKESGLGMEELKKRVAEEQKRVKAIARKRNTIVTLAFVGIYFLILYFIGDRPQDFNDYFSLVLSSAFLGVLHHAINNALYEELHNREKSERWLLEQLQKELREKEHEQFEQNLAESKKRIHSSDMD